MFKLRSITTARNSWSSFIFFYSSSNLPLLDIACRYHISVKLLHTCMLTKATPGGLWRWSTKMDTIQIQWILRHSWPIDCVLELKINILSRSKFYVSIYRLCHIHFRVIWTKPGLIGWIYLCLSWDSYNIIEWDLTHYKTYMIFLVFFTLLYICKWMSRDSIIS